MRSVYLRGTSELRCARERGGERGTHDVLRVRADDDRHALRMVAAKHVCDDMHVRDGSNERQAVGFGLRRSICFRNSSAARSALCSFALWDRGLSQLQSHAEPREKAEWQDARVVVDRVLRLLAIAQGRAEVDRGHLLVILPLLG